MSGLRQENSRKGTSTLKIVLARDSPGIALLPTKCTPVNSGQTACAPRVLIPERQWILDHGQPCKVVVHGKRYFLQTDFCPFRRIGALARGMNVQETCKKQPFCKQDKIVN